MPVLVSGLVVTTEVLGPAIYREMPPRDKLIVSFGMIPAGLIKAIEDGILLKIHKVTAAKLGCRVEEVAKHPRVNQAEINEVVSAAKYEIVKSIFKAANEAGQMRV